jgi:hypothetical protein
VLPDRRNYGQTEKGLEKTVLKVFLYLELEKYYETKTKFNINFFWTLQLNPALCDLVNKSPKTLFFTQKYFTRYTHETFFEEYTNFEVHYLSHCRVIPLQSFGSHIRPQPHGLGLIVTTAEGTEGDERCF